MLAYLFARLTSLEKAVEILTARVTRLEREISRLRQESQRIGGQI
jgi:ubiquinone biosynthesis protein UbiJ